VNERQLPPVRNSSLGHEKECWREQYACRITRWHRRCNVSVARLRKTIGVGERRETMLHNRLPNCMCRFVLACLAGALFWLGQDAAAFPVSEAAWSTEAWEAHCMPVRTSYNPDRPLTSEALTLTTDDPRFLDFLYWVWANKITEHQVEQVGGTEWHGPRASSFTGPRDRGGNPIPLCLSTMRSIMSLRSIIGWIACFVTSLTGLGRSTM